jgi:hypothetical protein
MLFSYFPYAAAFAGPLEAGIDTTDLGLGLALAPFVFIALAAVSRYPRPRRVLAAMGVLLLVGLSVGLVSPALGAAAGFAAGGALALRPPDDPRAMRHRLVAVVLCTAYTFLLLVVITPAGVFTGAVLPLMSLGFADEWTRWRASLPGASDGASDARSDGPRGGRPPRVG